MTQQEITMAINEKAAQINERKRRLASTDYIVIRADEQGTAIPADLKNERQGWRDDINALEAEIAELEALEPDEDDPSRSMEE